MSQTVKKSSENYDEVLPLLPGSLPDSGIPQKPTPLSKIQIGILLLTCLIEPIAAQSILPYINQLVSELDIIGGDTRKVGYYAGLIESLFFVTEALTVLQWGRMSDRVGRKPVLLLGTFGLCLSMLCFGLSRTFWGLVLSRCVTGALNGNIGVTKTMMGELTDATNRAQGLAFMPMTWYIGAVIGPVIGGSLSRPQDHFPRLFAASFWGDYPYFLPCLVAAMFATLTFMMILLLLNETLAGALLYKPRPVIFDGEETPRGGDYGAIYETDGPPGSKELDVPVPLKSLLVHKVLLPITCYGSISAVQIAVSALQPLFYSTPIEDGGLGFTPATIGFWMSCQGVANGIMQAFFFAPLISKLGPKALFRIGHGAYAVTLGLFPIIHMIARRSGIAWSVWALLSCQLFLSVFQGMSFSCAFLYVTASAPNPKALGAVNGLSQTTVSAVRAIGPALATSMFAYCVEHDVLGGYAVYLVMIVITLATSRFIAMLPVEPGK
ncbi:MFS general substrate transporter [Paxillus ammoniavirescens]|nr:MFS general substrate transporter [Paxillus ammoniavirescens]